MEVIRKVKKEVKKVQVGDQIVLGRYTATCMAVDNTGAIFCFDQVYGETPVKTPFDARRMKALYKSKAMDSIRNMLTLIQNVEDSKGVDPAEVPLLFFRSPTAEEVFPKQYLRPVSKVAVLGCDKRWEAMKDISYRLGVGTDGKVHCYWTESLVDPESKVYGNEGTQVIVNTVGNIAFDTPEESHYIFWRPVFKLKV